MLRGRVAGICVGVAAAVAATDVLAGEAIEDEIVAATDDGAFVAGFTTRDGNLEDGTCGLRKAGSKPQDLVARADPGGSFYSEMLPFEKWKWIDPTPAVKRLKSFETSGVDKVVRLGYEKETTTDVVEVFHAGVWRRVRALENEEKPAFKGVLKGASTYVVKMTFERDLHAWDELLVVTFAEVADERGRADRFHKEAQEATARMREHRKQGDGVFAPVPAGTKQEAWEKRRRHGIARFVLKWEIAGVFRPLSAAELKDALWLLAWFDSPLRRMEALRWTDAVRKREPQATAATVEELARDPDTRALVDYLKTTKDYLADTPVAFMPIDSAQLRSLSAEQLLWMHRWIQVHAGYHIDDTAVRQYFEGIGMYRPMSDRAWQKLIADPAWKKDPDAHLLRVLEKSNPLEMKNLAAILQAEAQRRSAPR
jgi:hypothetical protein